MYAFVEAGKYYSYFDTSGLGHNIPLPVNYKCSMGSISNQTLDLGTRPTPIMVPHENIVHWQDLNIGLTYLSSGASQIYIIKHQLVLRQASTNKVKWFIWGEIGMGLTVELVGLDEFGIKLLCKKGLW